VLRYPRHCIAAGITYGRSRGLWQIYCDSDFGGLPRHAQHYRRLRCRFFNGGVVLIRCQPTVAVSAVRLNTASLRLLCAWRCGRLPP
jgi:hypothetical protein